MTRAMTSCSPPEPGEMITLSTDVLVVGGGAAAANAAAAVADRGYGVILIHEGRSLGARYDRNAAPFVDRLTGDPRVEILADTRLVGATGFPGRFTVRLESGGMEQTREVGAVVIATEYSRKGLFNAYGVERGPGVVSQGDLETALEDGGFVEKAKKTVAFVVGFGQPGTPLVLQRVLDNIRSVLEKGGPDTEIYVFVGDMQLAAEGLDRLYAEARRAGVVHFRCEQAPRVEKDAGRMTLTVTDMVLRRDVRVEPDLLVVEEELGADPDNEVLARLLGIYGDPLGFLQPSNMHFYPVRTNREGIYVVGPARDRMDLPATLMDAENAAVAVARLLGDGTVEVPADRAWIDVDKCTICLTCARVCPHGAIYWDSRAAVSPMACQACGICTSECPMDAIQLGGYTDAEMTAKVADAAKKDGRGPRIVAFCCANSAWEAGMAARVASMELPDGLRMVKSPCAGAMDMEFILDAFVHGADGVIVFTCHPDNCRSRHGNTWAGWRVAEARRRLEDAGWNPDRLVHETTASNMGTEFSRIVVDLEKRISEMG
ncbi:MAG: hydrogenase iron-sulfur subunit [Desulfatibacillaceae bacterium]